MRINPEHFTAQETKGRAKEHDEGTPNGHRIEYHLIMWREDRIGKTTTL